MIPPEREGRRAKGERHVVGDEAVEEEQRRRVGERASERPRRGDALGSSPLGARHCSPRTISHAASLRVSTGARERQRQRLAESRGGPPAIGPRCSRWPEPARARRRRASPSKSREGDIERTPHPSDELQRMATCGQA